MSIATTPRYDPQGPIVASVLINHYGRINKKCTRNFLELVEYKIKGSTIFTAITLGLFINL